MFTHQVLENVVNPQIPAGLRTLADMRTEATRLWDTQEWPVEAADVPAFKLKVWDCLNKAATLEDLPSVNVLAAEMPLEAVMTWSGARIPFLGYVDRVDVVDDTVVLVDYKTGKMPSYQHQADALRQLMVYAAVVAAKPELGVDPPAKVKLVYLGSGDVLSSDVRPKHLREAVQWFTDGYWSIQAWLNKPADEITDELVHAAATPSALCGWCSYENSCTTGLTRSVYLRAKQHR